MSVLGFPRIHVRGRVSWDPSVSNNSRLTYDGPGARALLRPGETAEEMRTRLTTTEADRGDWNYFGTHRVTFLPVTVVGGLTGPGVAAAADDPLLDAPVELTGKLVDLDPTGAVSQLFFDELAIGRAGRPHLIARPVRRMVSRWLNSSRNLAGLPIAGRAAAAWQGVFAADDVELLRAGGSPLLSAFAQLLHDGQVHGLMLRLCTYRTEYFQNGVLNDLPPASDIAALQQLHLHGKPVSNPAWSAVVGVLGPWADGDSETMLAGRHLFGVPLPADSAAPAITPGPVAAELDVDAGLLSLDLSNTVPEVDAELGKVDLGRIDVVVVGDDVTPLGRIEPDEYGKAAYEARAGIVDLDVSAVADVERLLTEGTLELTVTSPSGSALLAAELPLTAACDQPTVYLDQAEPRDLVVTVRDRGRPAKSLSLSVLVARYGPRLTLVTGQETVLPVSSDGTVIVPVTGDAPGYHHLGFTVFPTDHPRPPTPLVLDVSTAQFVSVRTLPFDDGLATLPDEAVTWNLVFSTVLASYHAVTPRMSSIIDLADEDAVRTFARRIRELTATELFESARYMPVTRDLSRGRRALLHRWCDKVLGDGAPAVAVPEEAHVLGETADRIPGLPPEVTFTKRAPHSED